MKAIYRLLLPSLLCFSWLASAAPRPSLVIFLSDDHGLLDSTAYGATDVRTLDWKYILNLHPEFAHTTHIDQGTGAGDGWRYFREWAWASKTNTAAAVVVHRYNQRPREELYDLAADPHEQHNLAADPHHAVRLAQMRAQLEAWMQAQGDQRTVFQEPRLLSEPASYAPVTNQPPAATPAKKSARNNPPQP